MAREKKTDLDRAIEACKSKIQIESQVLERLLEARAAADTARAARRNRRKKPQAPPVLPS